MTPDWDGKPVTVPYAEFGDPQSLNLYSYVRNSPIARVDADGHMAVMFTSQGVGYIGSYGTSFDSDGLSDGDNPYADADRVLFVNAQGMFVVVAADSQQTSSSTITESNIATAVSNVPGTRANIAQTMCPRPCHHEDPNKKDNNNARSDNNAEHGGKASQSKPKIDWGKQGKHFEGHNNYKGGSQLTADPEKLAEKAGTGTPANNVPRGQPGFRERVDFGETIGKYVDPTTGKGVPTTKGIIHYGQNGIHIVPARSASSTMNTLEPLLLLKVSIQRALLGEVTHSLVSVTCGIRGKEIKVRAYYFGDVQAEDVERMGAVGAEVAADFPEDFMVEEECCSLETDPEICLDFWAFSRARDE